MQIDKAKIKNILVVRNDRFGEFLLNIPALRALKETFPNAKIIAVVSPYVRDLAGSVAYIDEIIAWGSEKHGLAEIINFIRLLRGKKADISVILNPSRDFNIITFLSHIPVRVGYNRKWGFLLTHKIEDKKHLAQKHEVEYNLELVGLIGAGTQDKNLSLSVNIAEAPDLRQFGIEDKAGLIALHPWTSDPIKQWPLSNFYALAELLSRVPNTRVIVIGGKENLEASTKQFYRLCPNLIDLTGKTTLAQLAAILKKCKLLISADSGPVHLACCVGTRVLAIFRNDLPGKTAKRWGPWGDRHIVVERPDLRSLTAEEVFGYAKKALGLN